MIQINNTPEPDSVTIEKWKGKSTLDISETKDYYIIREFQKKHKGAEPELIESKAYKKYVEVLRHIINRLNPYDERGKRWLWRKLFDVYDKELNERINGWKDFDFNTRCMVFNGDRRSNVEVGTYFVLYYYPMLYLHGIGYVKNSIRKFMRLE